MKICKFLKNVNDILKPHDTKSEWIPNKATINRAISNATHFSIHLECFSVTSNLYGLCKSWVLISGSAAELVEVLSSLEMWSLCLCCSQLAVDVVPMMLNKSVSLFLVLWVSVWVIVSGWSWSQSPAVTTLSALDIRQPGPAQHWAATHTHTIAEGQTFPHPKIIIAHNFTLWNNTVCNDCKMYISFITYNFMFLLHCKYI